MKVLIINGSPRPKGNTAIALKEMVGVFNTEGIETEIIQIGLKIEETKKVVNLV